MNLTETQHATAESRADSDGYGDERSIASLIKEIRDETTTLFRQEVALARVEISEKLSRLVRNMVVLAAGGLVAFAGLVVLLIAAGGGLTVALQAAGMEEHSLWLGPLIVAAIAIAIGMALVAKGKNSLQEESLVPEKTMESMKENKEWLTNKPK